MKGKAGIFHPHDHRMISNWHTWTRTRTCKIYLFRNAQPVILGSDKWGVHEVRSFYKYLCVRCVCVYVCTYPCVCLQYFELTAVCKLVNHLLHSKGRVEVKAGVYVCPGHTHIRSDLIGAECAVCLPMAPEPTWPREANLYGLCKQGLCLQRTAGGRADTQFTHTHVNADVPVRWLYRMLHTVESVHRKHRCCTRTYKQLCEQSCRRIEELPMFI